MTISYRSVITGCPNTGGHCRRLSTNTMTFSFLTPRRVAAAIAVAVLGGPLVADAGVAEAAGVESTSTAVAWSATAALDSLAAYEVTRDPVAYVRFLQGRDATAQIAATELGLDPEAMRVAWMHTEPIKQRALLAALTQLGVPYRSMASVEGVGFDCSGLTSYAWARAGHPIERSSGTQINAARRVAREQAQAGDLVYYPGHVSMYLGVADAIVHSPNSGNHVEITFMSPRKTGSIVFGDPTG